MVQELSLIEGIRELTFSASQKILVEGIKSSDVQATHGQGETEKLHDLKKHKLSSRYLGICKRADPVHAELLDF